MAKQFYENNVTVFLDSGIDSAATTITVNDASRIPNVTGGDAVPLTLIDKVGDVETAWEIVHVTGKSGNILTVVRGQDGTSARAWTVSTPAQIRVTNGLLSKLRDDPLRIENNLSDIVNDATARANIDVYSTLEVDQAVAVVQNDIDQFQTDLASSDTSKGASLVGWLQVGSNTVARTVLEKLRDVVSIKDFGAVGDGIADDTQALQYAISSGYPLYVPYGTYLVSGTITADANNVILHGHGKIKSTVSTGYVLDFGHSATGSDRYGVSIGGLRFERISGTQNCIRLRQCNLTEITKNVFSGFTGYGIDLYGSDGTKVMFNRLAGCSLRSIFEMDQLAVHYNEFSANTDHPSLEIYGGITVSVNNNFINWGQREGIVVGYDSVRGEFPFALDIRSNYMERLCQFDTGSPNVPFVHIGKPVDQDGNAYVGSAVSTWVQCRDNYFNADVSNTNLANVIPCIFERALEVDWDNNRVLNFVSNNPRVKSPLQRFKIATFESVTDISSSGNASVQVWRIPSSRYKTLDFYHARVTVTTDGSGNGSLSVSGLNTGLFGGFTSNDLSIQVTPESDCRLRITGKAVSSGTGADGSDQVSFTINVSGGPVSSSVAVMAQASVIIP